MLIPRVMPCLLKKGSALVKTIKFKDENYIGDPINTIKIYNDLEADELVLLDILATREKRKPPFDFIAQVASECFMPMTYGGGIREIDDMRRIFNLGVEKIVICTHAVDELLFIKQAAELFGSQSVVVSIDVKKNWGKYEVYIEGGTNPTKLDPVKFAVMMEQMGAGEIFLNSIDKDGAMEGYDLELIQRVASAVNVPLIACGGAGRIEDLGEAIKAGASAVAAGSLFVYQGKNRSVLINFPSHSELQEMFLGK